LKTSGVPKATLTSCGSSNVPAGTVTSIPSMLRKLVDTPNGAMKPLPSAVMNGVRRMTAATVAGRIDDAEIDHVVDGDAVGGVDAVTDQQRERTVGGDSGLIAVMKSTSARTGTTCQPPGSAPASP